MRAMMFGVLLLVAGATGVSAAEKPGDIQPVAGWRAAAPKGGCSSCGQVDTTRGHHFVRIGAGCETPVGCTPLAATRTFAFGSCNQFFNAGNDCSLLKGRNGHGGIAGGCGIPATPPCAYGTYHNR
jgi:hypothetical protein